MQIYTYIHIWGCLGERNIGNGIGGNADMPTALRIEAGGSVRSEYGARTGGAGGGVGGRL